MDTRELIRSIIASEEDAGDKFLESMEERISDALEVRKVELASAMMGGEVEQMDEAKYQGLSRDGLARYAAAAARRIRSSTSLAGKFDKEAAADRRRGDKEGADANQSLSSEYQRAAKNRIRGITRATERLAREEVEQVDEADMSDAQRLQIMKDKNRSQTLAALARLKKVGGDPNKLPPGQRSLAFNYMEKTGGVGGLSRGIQTMVLKQK